MNLHVLFIALPWIFAIANGLAEDEYDDEDDSLLPTGSPLDRDYRLTDPEYSAVNSSSSNRTSAASFQTKPVAGGDVECVAGPCHCVVVDSNELVLRCVTRDTLTSFPVLKRELIMKRIQNIIITDQPQLTEIDSSSLGLFPALRRITIEYSGLRNVSLDAFKYNTDLRSINLRKNELTEFPWQTIDGLRFLSDLNIEENPISCRCVSRWLVNFSETFPSLSLNLRRPPQCNDSERGGYLSEMTWAECELPVAEVSSEYSEVNVSDRIELSCTGRRGGGGGASPSPSSSAAALEPRVYWKITEKFFEGFDRRRSDDRLSETLVISRATPKHSGTIWCVAENAAGRVRASSTLVVLSAPKILDLGSVRNEFHQLIPYHISGLPVPNVTWYRDSLPLSLNEIVFDQSTPKTSYVSRHGYLVFTIVNHLNNGNYTLVAENEFGRDNRTIYANFLSPPDGPVIFEGGTPGIPYGFTTRNDTVRGPEGPNEEYLDSNFLQLVRLVVVCIVVVFILCLGLVCGLLFCQRKRKSAFHENRCFRSLCPDRNRNSVYCDTIAREMIPLNSARIVDNPNYFKHDPTSPTAGGKVPVPRIPKQNIAILRDLGEGAFGRVVLGTCKLTEPDGDRLTLVAIKTLKESHAEDAKRDFDREAELLTNLQHENIVRLYGISEDGDTRMIVFEYMENGDLNNFLRSHSPDARFLGKDFQSTKPCLRLRELLYISKQTAAGAEYLAHKHFVHRDLATRNCLVGEKLTVKIGDFGMSRDVYSADYYKVGGQTMLPIRWMPYESILYRTFTMESDVWSFGVVLWEIFSFGKQPWYELTNHEVIQHLEMGKVLDCPVGGHCPEEVYRLMLGCWRKHPQDRLTMSQLHVHLTRLLQCFSDDPAPGSQDAYIAKHAPYLEILSDDAA